MALCPICKTEKGCQCSWVFSQQYGRKICRECNGKLAKQTPKPQTNVSSTK